MEESVLLGTKPLVDSNATSSGTRVAYFPYVTFWECRIVQWRHNSRLLLLLNWFLHIIKRTFHVGSKIWILCSCGKNCEWAQRTSEILFLPLEHKIHIFSSPCNILYIWTDILRDADDLSRGGSKIFLRRGCTAKEWRNWLMNINKPHFFGRIPVILESFRGGGCAPPAPSP